jgi:hypothetical protein
MRLRHACRAVLGGGGLVAAAVACGAPAPAPPRASAAGDAADDSLVVARPTVVAYLVVPPGAVDTSEALAITADDWSYAMATLGDSLEAHGIAFTLETAPRLRIAVPGAPARTFALDEGIAAGYVFARPGAPPCIRRGAADADVVLAAARVFFGDDSSAEARARVACGPVASPT